MNNLEFIFILIIALIPLVSCGDSNVSVFNLLAYNKWRQQYQRSFSNESEKIYRQMIFLENLISINKHNSNPDKDYEQGLNQFSDLTDEEWVEQYITKKPKDYVEPSELARKQEIEQNQQKENEGTINKQLTQELFPQRPPKYPFRSGAFPMRKNVGPCNKPHVQMTVYMHEAYIYMTTGKPVKLSDQYLYDCWNINTQAGCSESGWTVGDEVNLSFSDPIFTEAEYPWTGINQKCLKLAYPGQGYQFKQFQPVFDEPLRIRKTAYIYPTVVNVDASKWKNYSSGKFTDCEKGDDGYHAALIWVGTDDYWVLRNSWGSSWGMQGHIQVPVDRDCGVVKGGAWTNYPPYIQR